MPHDEVEADQLASPHLTGTHHRAIVRAAALRGVWRSVAFSQAVAIGRRYWQAARAQRVIIRRGAFGNSVKQLPQALPGRLITSRPTPGSASTDTPLLSDRRTWS